MSFNIIHEIRMSSAMCAYTENLELIVDNIYENY